MNLGNKIKRLRKQKLWSQQQLAEHVGVHPTHISRLETDRYTPSLELLKKLSQVLDTSADYLISEFESFSQESNSLSDQSLYQKFKLIEHLDQHDRDVIHSVIDAFLTKQEIWRAINKPDIKKYEEAIG